MMHPAGYSIIAPPDWESRIDAKSADAYGKDRMHLRPMREGLWQPEITVVRLAKPPDAAKLKQSENFIEGTFQGADALVFDRPIKKYWVYKVILPRAGEWFEVSVATPDYEDIRHGAWYAYLETFRYPDPKYVPKVTSKPATHQIDVGH